MTAELKNLIKIAKALADENRFQILQLILEKGEISCSEIVKVFSLSQPTISHHLKVLTESGLVDFRKEGQWSYFFVNQDRLRWYLEQLGNRLGGAPNGPK